jgi:hypothetical protein
MNDQLLREVTTWRASFQRTHLVTARRKQATAYDAPDSCNFKTRLSGLPVLIFKDRILYCMRELVPILPRYASYAKGLPTSKATLRSTGTLKQLEVPCVHDPAKAGEFLIS